MKISITRTMLFLAAAFLICSAAVAPAASDADAGSAAGSAEEGAPQAASAGAANSGPDSGDGEQGKRIFTSLAEGFALAAKKEIPILLVLASGENADAVAEGEKVLAAGGLEAAAGERLAVVCANLPIRVSHGDEERAAYDKIAEKHRVLMLPVQFLVLDPAAGKVFFRGGKEVKLDRLAAEIAKVLPPPPQPPYSGEWIEDYEKARGIALETGRTMLLDFTGSDWCPWCMRLDKEIFATEEFKSFAEKNLVDVKVDFPRQRQMPPDVKQQNASLMQKYKVTGYPTVIVLDPQEKLLGQLGYMEGGPKPFLERLKVLIKGSPPKAQPVPQRRDNRGATRTRN